MSDKEIIDLQIIDEDTSLPTGELVIPRTEARGVMVDVQGEEISLQQYLDESISQIVVTHNDIPVLQRKKNALYFRVIGSTVAIAGVSTAVGGLVKITTLTPLAGTASGNIRGATGAAGATGATGAKGDPGDKGDKGDPGDKIKIGATVATAREATIFLKVVD